ncbi:hypothetical protein CAI16_08200 [Virgibacillus dokdonensis]|uniref:Uncharacterized protein n=1 Tax=Virgibacillus dokdonensis TaxID=302167 RepID=A0A3E0WU12_9BACI|nr:hypothetical protein [Virgibacillus dokdonensis]RFA35466.1 hypothetical protein CAI16_08200 [Virgibacillus dokdonensis]
MKQNIFRGLFSQVEETVSESFAKSSINTIKGFGLLKASAFMVFFIGLGSYALYGASIYMGNNMDKAAFPLDVTNEFIPVFSNIWYMHIQALLISIVVITALIYKEKNNIKAFFYYNLFFTLFIFLFTLFFFKVSQLFVNEFWLRMLYTVLFISSIVYIFLRSYHNAKKMVYGTKKKRSAIVEWFSRNRKSVMSTLFGVWGIYYLAKVIFPETGDFETRLYGSLAEFAPLIMCLASFVFLYFNSVVIRSYYLYKYSEQFRQKFGIDEKDWYGEKYQG